VNTNGKTEVHNIAQSTDKQPGMEILCQMNCDFYMQTNQLQRLWQKKTAWESKFIEQHCRATMLFLFEYNPANLL